MAVENTKSSVITDLDKTPPKAVEALLMGGRLREAVATAAVAAADDDTSTYRFVRVHSSWRLAAILLLNDAITGGTSFDVGLYETAENGGAAKDADLFATAVDLSSARVDPLDVLHEALDINKGQQRIWEMLGESVDPNRFYDLVLTANTVGTAAGDITVKVRYVDGS